MTSKKAPTARTPTAKTTATARSKAPIVKRRAPVAKAKAPVAKASEPTAAAGEIAWTRETRALVYGPRHPHPLDPEPLTGEAAWRAIRDFHGAPELPGLDELSRPHDLRFEPVLAGLRRELASPELPDRETTVEREQLRAALLLEEGAPEKIGSMQGQATAEVASILVPFWLKHLGARRTAEVLFSPAFMLDRAAVFDIRRPTVFRLLVPTMRHPRPSLAEESTLWWLHLRRAVGVDVAEARAATADLAIVAEVRAALWHDADEAHRLASAPPRTAPMPRGKVVSFPASAHLLSAVTDPDIALAFAQQVHPWNYAFLAGHHAFNVVDNLGPAAAPVLVSLLRQVVGGEEARRNLAEAAVLADAAYCRAVPRTYSDLTRSTLRGALERITSGVSGQR